MRLHLLVGVPPEQVQVVLREAKYNLHGSGHGQYQIFGKVNQYQSLLENILRVSGTKEERNTCSRQVPRNLSQNSMDPFPSARFTYTSTVLGVGAP